MGMGVAAGKSRGWGKLAGSGGGLLEERGEPLLERGAASNMGCPLAGGQKVLELEVE